VRGGIKKGKVSMEILLLAGPAVLKLGSLRIHFALKNYVKCNPYQNSNIIIHRNRKNSPKIHMETQKSLNRHSSPEGKSNTGGIYNTWPQIYYSAIVTKTAWY
jgi:hypothetical protein